MKVLDSKTGTEIQTEAEKLVSPRYTEGTWWSAYKIMHFFLAKDQLPGH